MIAGPRQPMRFAACGPLRGVAAVPGDKSISHRALIIASVADGRSSIAGLSDGADLLSTAGALRALGASIAQNGKEWIVDGVGPAGLRSPEGVLDMGNSGTSARLLMGLVASHPIEASFTGDASLRTRPMDRVIGPLRRMGALVNAEPGDRLPLTLRGAARPQPVRHETRIASAQVKSALLLAALNTPGETAVAEAVPTRNHTELMLRHFGAPVRIDLHGTGVRVGITGPISVEPRQVRILGDFSAAAFLLVAALIVPGSEVRVEALVLNPMRTGLFTLLRRMGADLSMEVSGEMQGEPIGAVTARHSRLVGGSFFTGPSAPMLIASAIDEFPIFFIAAAFASGGTEVTGLSELRVKESDRISAMAAGLRAIGANVEERGDGLAIAGSGGDALAGGATIDPGLDHRVAMAFAVAGLHCREPVTIADMSPVRTSFPGFARALAEIGANPEEIGSC
ncbi:MAG TPA: 3-phosphoshikimate 1-carboxyvinyltransferase [Allosphingosinicella sp.]|jgi:3-phosphoshikimate 1-carboxyvinyltransferase|uniref:3-phosphoshikimate 1-carboxyvinyltransferase n=1 Tax=Allosphingosinicella sp. TaxID=2823234 RepID=UPI002F2A7B1D